MYTLYNCLISGTDHTSQMARNQSVGPLSSTLSQHWNVAGSVPASLRIYCHMTCGSQAIFWWAIDGNQLLALMSDLGGGVEREARGVGSQIGRHRPMSGRGSGTTPANDGMGLLLLFLSFST